MLLFLMGKKYGVVVIDKRLLDGKSKNGGEAWITEYGGYWEK